MRLRLPVFELLGQILAQFGGLLLELLHRLGHLPQLLQVVDRGLQIGVQLRQRAGILPAAGRQYEDEGSRRPHEGQSRSPGVP